MTQGRRCAYPSASDSKVAKWLVDNGREMDASPSWSAWAASGPERDGTDRKLLAGARAINPARKPSPKAASRG